jgi:PAS domain-containing protein
MNNEWDQIEIWSSRIAGITAIAGAIYGMYVSVRKTVSKIFNISNRIQYISEQLESNGGTSLRDTINRIEARQVQTEQRERAFLQTHPNMMFELDLSLGLVWANRTFLDTLDVDSDTVAGYGWHNIISEKDRDRVLDQFETAKNAVRNVNTCAKLIVSSDLSQTIETNIVATVMRSSNGDCSGYLVTINTIKKLKITG